MKTTEIGKIGENIAVQYLKDKGYEILNQNWRYSRAEVDIIAKYDDHLIFVEVKARSYDYYGEPAEFVTQKKEDFMMSAAVAYMDEIDYEWKFRFDVISIILKDGVVKKIVHYEDAFRSGW